MLLLVPLWRSWSFTLPGDAPKRLLSSKGLCCLLDPDEWDWLPLIPLCWAPGNLLNGVFTGRLLYFGPIISTYSCYLLDKTWLQACLLCFLFFLPFSEMYVISCASRSERSLPPTTTILGSKPWRNLCAMCGNANGYLHREPAAKSSMWTWVLCTVEIRLQYFTAWEDF